MSTRPIGAVRRAQLITTYGVGAVIAVESSSYMVAGIDLWPDHEDGNALYEPRLQRELHVRGFRLPPSSESERRGDVPVVRFPTDHYCPESGVLAHHRKWGRHTGTAKCTRHDRDLVPSRFVMCCPHGHIDDFPYFRWVHAGSPKVGDEHELRIDASGRSAALRDIVIKCSCGKSVSMEGALSKGALKGIAPCTGRRPWLNDARGEPCEQVPRGMQRGASGVWFSVVRSAISIPPWSEGVQRAIARHWTTLSRTRHLRDTVVDLAIAEGKPFSVDDVVKEVERRKHVEAGDDSEPAGSLKEEEYAALVRETPESTRDQDFVCVAAETAQVQADIPLAQAMRVKRLREVRVLESFTRIESPGPADDRRRRASLSSADPKPDWLPAIEVIGEGVFLRFDEERLAEWESRSAVSDRVAPLDKQYIENIVSKGGERDRSITPRLVMIHTFAHALINEWSLDCGYPAASLRERLYVSDEMAGVLVYTATSDSAGSLGGIVAQVESGDLSASVRRAIDRVSWCSADPLCMETSIGGALNLNRAACHACILLPETSCEEYNTLLDRAVLVGTHDKPGIGFFSARTT